MPTSPTSSVIEHLRRTVLREAAGLGDGELLGRFLERHDEAALAALVRRHGPMVWGVCRRLLGHHDAEDAFQATFLVLVKKAASVVPRELVGNFLYGVAHQTALQARRTAARRRAREVQVTVMPDAEAVQQDQWLDVKPLLDQELSRLPDIYRAVLVLCDLEGRTRKEVARQLGVPEGTVAGRLARARAMLAKRLTERGVTLSGGVLAAVLARNGASAGVANSVGSSTIKAASLLAAGQAAAGGAISVKVAALTEGVMKAMLFTKLKAAIAVLLILGLLATGATIFTCRTAAGQDDKKPAAEKPVEPAAKQEKEKEAFTAWGKEVGGLQAGLGFRPGEKRAYRHGEEATVVLRVRNVGKEAMEFKHIGAFFVENPPTITDADGKGVQLPRVFAEGLQASHSTNVAPGKEVELYEWNIHLLPKGATSKNLVRIHGTGKFTLQCERVVGPTSGNPNHPNPTLDKLATGKLELEVKEAKKPEKKEQEKEAFTAWGKEVSGLQAGLGFQAGQKRPYYHGKTVTLVYRVRNVGKNEVKFEYPKEVFEELPYHAVDSTSKPIPQEGAVFSGTETRVQVTLAPSQEIELFKNKIELRPGNKASPHSLWASGKVSLWYERVFGNTTSGRLDPALSELATGKLELEIKSDPPPAPSGKASDERPIVPVMTPKEIEAKMEKSLAKVGSPYWDGPVIVECGIRSVASQQVSTADGKSYENAVLHPDDDSKRFSIVLTPKAQAAMKRLGIDSLEKHFRGKQVRVQGKIGLTSLNLVGSPSKYFYDLLVDELDQIVEVRSAAIEKK